MYPSFDLWDSEVKEDLWWAPYVQGFRVLSATQGPLAAFNSRNSAGSPTIKEGIVFNAMAVNVPRYLLYLQEKAKHLGVTVIKSRLPTEAGFKQALVGAETIASASSKKPVSCFVNATGIGALKLCGDQTIFPIRGQTVLVKGEATNNCTRYGDGYGSYCIPRPGSGTTILGGVKQVGNWSGELDAQTTRDILEWCKILAPELCTGPGGEFEVISVQCGHRPGRKDGPRFEKEDLDGKKIVHAYGNAGGG